ncbi:hypothetical protein [Nocardiopsis sp. Huas11]|uniref:hypothetical protein n=1 Tax=Nocardiopsis sp. Huas11 TaxID=2183912 RepID=UPI0011C39EF4|nr:hypothetical protein [Nocardiopsis sp. Huas11]
MLTADIDLAPIRARARLTAWWVDLVARTPEVPEGAHLVGWDTVLVEDEAAQDRAVAAFGGRLVVLLDVGEAADMGLVDGDRFGGTDADGAEFPVMVCGLRWEA